MVGEGSTYIELKGKFTFSINQSGLDYKNKEEREDAIQDFKEQLEAFAEKCERNGFISLDYSEVDIKVSEGE